MSFTDGNPFVVNELQAATKWGGDGLRCGLCWHDFKVGETARFVYANGGTGTSYGNFLTCTKCDGPDVLERHQQAARAIYRFEEGKGILGRSPIAAMAHIQKQLRLAMANCPLMFCPNCDMPAYFEEKEARWTETHGLDCGPFETGTDRWVECSECGARTDEKELDRANRPADINDVTHPKYDPTDYFEPPTVGNEVI